MPQSVLKTRLLAPLFRRLVRFPQMPYKYTLLRRLFDPAKGFAMDYEASFFGLRYRGNTSNEIDWHVYFFGAYAMDELSLLAEIVTHIRQFHKKQIVFCDIGANVGNHTLFMSQHADRVHSFEPYAKVYSQLESRLDLNNIGNVTVHHCGLGSEDGIVDFYEPPEDNLGSGTLIHPAGAPSDRSLQIEVRAGDNYFLEIGLVDVDIIKIDVEGFEPYVLQGLRQTIQRCRPVVLMELLDDTRAVVGDEAGLRALLYPGARIRDVSRRRDGGYQLSRFSFERSREFIVIPDELWKNWGPGLES